MASSALIMTHDTRKKGESGRVGRRVAGLESSGAGKGKGRRDVRKMALRHKTIRRQKEHWFLHAPRTFECPESSFVVSVCCNFLIYNSSVLAVVVVEQHHRNDPR